jgi:hypothetical protein
MQHLLRNKIVAASFCLFLFNGFASAQLRESINLPDHDSRLFHFGIQLGVNRAHFNFTNDKRFLTLNGAVNDSVMVVESLNSTGINLSWLVNMNISEHLDLRTYPLNLVFTEKAFQYHLKYPDRPAGEEPVVTKKIQGITLALPLQLKFSSDRINNFKVYMMAGGRIEYDLASNAGARKAESLVKLSPFDYGVDAGMGFHFYFPYFVLSPELKIGWGFSNLHSRDENLKYSNVLDKINSRTITFSLTVE